MRLLVTRAEGQAEETAAELRARGHEPILAPLLDIVLGRPPENLVEPAAIAVTSRNGVKALAAWPEAGAWRGKPVFVTGEATAAAAREAGFADVRAGSGDVAGLCDRILAELPAANGPVLYVTGRDRAGDLAGALAGTGYDVRTVEAYRAEARPELDPAVAEALRAGTIDGALFFSARTAAAFVDRVEAAGLAGAAARIVLYALSEAVAAPRHRLGTADIRVAERPEAAALLALLDPATRPRVTGR